MRRGTLVPAVLLLVLGGPAGGQDELPLVEGVELSRLRDHCRQLVQVLAREGAPLPADAARALERVLADGTKDPAGAVAGVQQLLDPFCLVGVTINPESRVKAARGQAAATLPLGKTAVLLVKVHNDAGVTHRLTVSGPQLRSGDGKDAGRWLEATAFPADAREGLSGYALEYVPLRLRAHEPGKREATLRFDVGQGTQDLGFRAEVPVLFTVR